MLRLTTEDFRAVGEALFGPNWQTPLALALMPDSQPKSAIRNVQRWAKDGPPAWVWPELNVLCVHRAKALVTWAENIIAVQVLTA